MSLLDGYFIGLMTGTSVDGIDAVLVHIDHHASADSHHIQVIDRHSHPVSDELRADILQLCAPGKDEIDRAFSLSRKLALAYADCIKALLHKCQRLPSDITAIGSHGQTIRHRPNQAFGFSLQIGDASTLALKTGITVVADFRQKDIAAGGQGAPLVPTFHCKIFSGHQPRLIINIGGIANITHLPPHGKGELIGFDTGPGNLLMDAWIGETLGKSYDSEGNWARQGVVSQLLLERLMRHPYLQKSIPKSTGREDFHLDYLRSEMDQAGIAIPPEDVQRTLLEFTAQTISYGIKRTLEPTRQSEIFVCGGGTYNRFLMERLKALNPQHYIETTDKLGIHPMDVEGATFAWLAYRTLNRLTGSTASVTGADTDQILGGIYYA